ncbi:MAG: hypothetical protein M1828_003752 [Chrysothrix sp. TS-e1954]|nr:MAG: hypothetical protein M1828_003752 [Chrysothrix sp. TS-e1954]
MAESDAFDIISSVSSKAIYPDFEDASSGRVADLDVQLTKFLRTHYPDLTLTTVPAQNVPLLAFAGLGNAIAELDTKTDSVHKWRGYYRSSGRDGAEGLADAVFFAKYHYKWGYEDFIMYTVAIPYQGTLQYVLKEPAKSEDALSNCAKTDALIKACVKAFSGNDDEYIYVFDGYWTRSKELWEQVRSASWDNVILDQKMKDALVKVSTTFFDSRETYEQYGVPWKRGIVFHGPPGNGKTLSVKALMHSLYEREDPKPRLLYVKSASQTYQIGNVFSMARAMSPCILIMEDIETIVTQATRAYAFNEMDGLQNNNGIFMLATTNYLERLDPGLSKRPSRFDRKYLFPLPNRHERILYAEFWRKKLAKAPTKIPFPEKLCPAISDITADFSFAYIQEAFIATLLSIARDSTDEVGKYDDCEDVADLAAYFRQHSLNSSETGGGPDSSHPELDGYKLWRVMKAQVKNLRQDMGSGDSLPLSLTASSDEIFSSREDSQTPPAQQQVPQFTSRSQASASIQASAPTHLPDNTLGITNPTYQSRTKSALSASTHLPEYSGGRTFEAQQARSSSPASGRVLKDAGGWQGQGWGRPSWM